MKDEASGIQLVLPMAGKGQRFQDQGYEIPKPLLDVHGVHMFEVVLANLMTPHLSAIHVVCQKHWGVEEWLLSRAEKLGVRIHVLEIDFITEGPAATVELVLPFLNESNPVVVANSDQYVDAELDNFYDVLISGDVSGAVLTMRDQDAKWSYADVNANMNITNIVEKTVISEFATVGIYGFYTAADLSSALEQMREANDRVNGELYVGPSYNYLSRKHGPVKCIDLGPVTSVMFGMGTPEDYETFLATESSHRGSLNAKKYFTRNQI